MNHPIKTPTVEVGVNDQPIKSESHGNYTKNSLTYKEPCDSIRAKNQGELQWQ